MTTTTTSAKIQNLSDLEMVTVYSFLPVRDLVHQSAICKAMRGKLNSNEMFAQFLQRDFQNQAANSKLAYQLLYRVTHHVWQCSFKPPQTAFGFAAPKNEKFSYLVQFASPQHMVIQKSRSGTYYPRVEASNETFWCVQYSYNVNTLVFTIGTIVDEYNPDGETLIGSLTVVGQDLVGNDGNNVQLQQGAFTALVPYATIVATLK